MKFTTYVRRNKIAWPTQTRFDRQTWIETAKKTAEDEADNALATMGLWVDDTLGEIRSKVAATSIWDWPFGYLASNLIVMCNHDFMNANAKMASASSELHKYPLIFAPNLLYHLSESQWWGAPDITSLLESSVDAAEFCLRFAKNDDYSCFPVNEQDFLETKHILNLSISYMAAQDCFYKALWLDWRLVKSNEGWIVVPEDLWPERMWAVALRRFESISSESTMREISMWTEAPFVRQEWLLKSGGTPVFKIRVDNGLVYVDFVKIDEAVPEHPPRDYLNDRFSQVTYYEPLLSESLPGLEDACISDVIQVFGSLQAVARQIEERTEVSVDHARIGVNHFGQFSPVIMRQHLIDALVLATKMPPTTISAIIEKLSWNSQTPKDSSLWFTPLIPVKTTQGAGYLLTMLPVLAPNLYRSIDHWLEIFGLSLERRGSLFEEEIVEVLQEAIDLSDMNHDVSVYGSMRIGMPGQMEEIDAILRLHETLIVIEAKCQRFPGTPVERKNYLDTLASGCAQAHRKAKTVDEDRRRIARKLGLKTKKVSGKVIPVVVTNHPMGVGMSYDGVPILDVLSLRNYILKPYHAGGTFEAGKFTETSGKPIYRNRWEMASFFPHYAALPLSVSVYLPLINPILVDLPLRSTERVQSAIYTIVLPRTASKDEK